LDFGNEVQWIDNSGDKPAIGRSLR
jgi:hypothetical protein